MIEPVDHAFEIRRIEIKSQVRIFVVRSSPTLALLGEAEDRMRNSVLDKAWNLVHQFTTENFGIE